MKIGNPPAAIERKDSDVYRTLRSLQVMNDLDCWEEENNASSISIGTATDTAFSDVSQEFASIDLTGFISGNYVVEFEFELTATGTAGNTLTTRTGFILADETVSQSPVYTTEKGAGAVIGGVGGVSASLVTIVTIYGVFEIPTVPITQTSRRKIKLKKKNTASTNVSSRTVSNLTVRAWRIFG